MAFRAFVKGNLFRRLLLLVVFRHNELLWKTLADSEICQKGAFDKHKLSLLFEVLRCWGFLQRLAIASVVSKQIPPEKWERYRDLEEKPAKNPAFEILICVSASHQIEWFFKNIYRSLIVVVLWPSFCSRDSFGSFVATFFRFFWNLGHDGSLIITTFGFQDC